MLPEAVECVKKLPTLCVVQVIYSPFCLGMTDFNCCDVESDHDAPPEPKRSKLSLAKKKPLSPTTRFNTTVTKEEIEKSSKGCIPATTAKSTNWAVRTFLQWLKQRNERIPREAFPMDILS